MNPQGEQDKQTIPVDELEKKIHLQKQYRALMGVCPDPIVVYDPEGNTLYINQAFTDTYGWRFEELKGNRIDSFVPESEIERTRDGWIRTLNGEKIFLETRRLTKDRRLLDIQLRTAILKDQNEQHLASIVIHRDVTHIKRIEREKEAVIEQLKLALAKNKILQGLLPICSYCKKIRDDKGYWNQIEAYIQSHSSAEFSHSICPECAHELYPDLKI